MFGMSRKKLQCGIQILDRQVKIIGAAGSSSNKIVKSHSVQLGDGMIKEGKILDVEALSKKIAGAVAQLSLEGEEVTLTIPTSSIVLRKASFPLVKDKELRNLIDIELHGGGSQLPFKNPIFDYIPIKGTGEGESKEQEVLIFASPLEVVEQYVQVVRDAGLVPVAVDTAPLALFRLLLKCQKASGRTLPERFMLLDADADRAEISIFTNGYPAFFRSVSIPAHLLLDEGGDRTEAYSRQLSVEMGRVMNYYKYSIASGDSEVDELILIGDLALTESITKALEQDFKRISALAMDSAISNFEPDYKSFAVPIGLAMKGA